MNNRKFKRMMSLTAAVVVALGVVLGSGCELVVNEDLSLVDAGIPDACSLCYDGEVLTLDDGNILLIPNDGGTDDGATTDSDASDASDGEAQ